MASPAGLPLRHVSMSGDVCELVIRGTVGLAIAGYAARYAVEIAGPASAVRARYARALWTAGCALYLVHVASAFHCVHHWSHANAYEHTADVTARVVGFRWGGGIYFNDAFTLLWVVDVIDWWLKPHGALRPRSVWNWTIETYMAFIVINATIVFGPLYWRWIFAVACAFLVLIFTFRVRAR